MSAVEAAPRPLIVVAAGVLRNARGEVLLGQRAPGKHLAGTWEFPGGKREYGETGHEALSRELHEELGIDIGESTPLLSLTHDYPELSVRLMLREVRDWRGEPVGREGQALRWVAPASLPGLDMPPADRPVVRVLPLDPRYAITPDPSHFDSIDAWLAHWQGLLDQGFRLLQLRAHSLDATARVELARRCGELARRAGARWMLNATPQEALQAGADGVHLGSDLLADFRRPEAAPADWLVAASCHSTGALARAGAAGVDFVTLSLVRPTATRPRAPSLGWERFGELCTLSPVPVFALGGVGPDDLGQARSFGAFGVSGIGGFPAR